MPAIFDLIYREYCRARLAEMRKQLLISPERHAVPEAICDAQVLSAQRWIDQQKTLPIARAARRFAGEEN